jgi:methylmalonyl-CoA/ethylmalonyl-CoA epimerase
MELHHYGFATEDIERSEATYKLLGFERCSDIITDPVQNVRLLFIRNGDSNTPLIELVEPLSEQSPVSGILKKSKASLYHSCYIVDDMTAAIQELKQNRFVLLSQPVSAIAFENRQICFLFNKHVGLVELLER